MTPYQSASPKHAFAQAAKKDDRDAMRQLLSAQPEALSHIGVPDLYLAFHEALRDNRMGTAEFLLRETRLAESLPQEALMAQAKHFGRSLDIPKAP